VSLKAKDCELASLAYLGCSFVPHSEAVKGTLDAANDGRKI
jgi:hypothetical protein